MEVISEGLSNNIVLPLESLDIDCRCTFTTAATRSLVQFITRNTTLQCIRICHVTFSAQGLIELTEAIHHYPRLLEKKHYSKLQLEELLFCVECSEDVVNLRHMFKDHPNMKNSRDWNRVTWIHTSAEEIDKFNALTLGVALEYHHITSLLLNVKGISDAGTIALAQALHYNSTLRVLDLSNNTISDAGTKALAQVLHCNSTLERLFLSNNNISDAGAVTLPQALYLNSTLKRLWLPGNGAIGKEGTHQLMLALTVNTCITTRDGRDGRHFGGLTLPISCKEYATQCTQYNTVKDRIWFH